MVIPGRDIFNFARNNVGVGLKLAHLKDNNMVFPDFFFAFPKRYYDHKFMK